MLVSVLTHNSLPCAPFVMTYSSEWNVASHHHALTTLHCKAVISTTAGLFKFNSLMDNIAMVILSGVEPLFYLIEYEREVVDGNGTEGTHCA